MHAHTSLKAGLLLQAVRGSALEAVPNYGGSSPTSAQGTQGAGLGPIKTPRQLVAELDKHVVGQDHAKKARSLAFLRWG